MYWLLRVPTQTSYESMNNTRQNEIASPHWQSFNIFPNLTGPQNITFDSFYFFCAKANRPKMPFSFPPAFPILSQLTQRETLKHRQPLHCRALQGCRHQFLMPRRHQTRADLGKALCHLPVLPEPGPATAPTTHPGAVPFTGDIPHLPKAVIWESQAA